MSEENFSKVVELLNKKIPLYKALKTVGVNRNKKNLFSDEQSEEIRRLKALRMKSGAISLSKSKRVCFVFEDSLID